MEKILKPVYYTGLTKEEAVIFNILTTFDKKNSTNFAIKFLFIIRKASYIKPNTPAFYDWKTCDFKFLEPDANVVSFLINQYPKKSTVVEIGVWKGWGTSLIIPKLKKEYKYICVDWFKGSPTETCENANPTIVKEKFWERLRKNKIDKKIELREGPSTEIAKTFDNNSISVLFLDASHSEPYFSNDVKAWHNKVKIDGIFSGHDKSDVGERTKKIFTKENGYEEIELLFEEFGKHDCWAYKKIKEVNMLKWEHFL